MLYPPHAALMITMLAPSWSGVDSHSALGIILLSMAAAMPFSGRPASAIRAERVVAWVSLGVLLIWIFIFLFLFISAGDAADTVAASCYYWGIIGRSD